MAKKIFNSILLGLMLFTVGYVLNYLGTAGYTTPMVLTFHPKLTWAFLLTDIFPLYLGGKEALFSAGDIFLVLAPIITIFSLIRGYIYEKNNNI